MKILLAADGSPYTCAAARYVRSHLGDWPGTHEIHVVHVQAPLPHAGRATAVLGTDAIERMRVAEREVAFEAARVELEGVDAKVVYSVVAGDIAERIDAYATGHGVQVVVMGSHGLGGLAAAILGSATRKVIARSSVPVMVIPRAAAQSRPAAPPVEALTT